MSYNLQCFLLNFIQPRLNDPSDRKFWLPGLLQSMKRIDGDPLLPLYEDSAAAVTLTCEHADLVSRALVGAWETNSCKFAIPYPASPAPVIALSNLSITGLQNVALQALSCTARPDGSGYACSIELSINHYTSLPSGCVNGRYMLQQDFCTGRDATRASRDTERRTITVTGGFTARLERCRLTVQVGIDLAGAAPSCSMEASVASLALGGEEPKHSPMLAISDVTVNGGQQWVLGPVEMALGQPEARGAILAVIAASLNQPENLEAIGQVLSSAMKGALESLFPAGAEPCLEGQAVPGSGGPVAAEAGKQM